MKISGIYLIINCVNGKQYVGSSSNIAVRFSYHREKLNKNVHDNAYLQHSWNKYGGEDAFKFVVVEEVPE